ncbi:hypothetical protein JCM10207_000349 [Rhodosporidiobolus poonsookiae]
MSSSHSLAQHPADSANNPRAPSQPAQEPDKDELERRKMLDDEAEQLEQSNGRLKERLRKLEDELEAMQDEDEAGMKDDDDDLDPIDYELALLESTFSILSAAKAQDDPAFTQSTFVADEAAYTAMVQTLEELRKVWDREERKKREEEETMERETTFLADVEQINEILTEQIERSRASDAQPDAELVVLRAQGRLDHLANQFKTLQRGLIDFVDYRLAEVDQEEESRREEGGEGKRKKRKVELFDLRRWIQAEGADKAESRAFQLKKLIEVLMNASVRRDSPSSASTPSPWVTLSSLDPPPPRELVAFLLRARIAREHKTDPGRIRLEEFGVVL